MTPGRGTPRRVRWPYVEWLMQSLSSRDWAIIESVARLRLVRGDQLERLHFTDLTGRSRKVMRWKVLKRLVDARVLATLDRRVGTAIRGSAKLCFALDTAGQRLMQLRANQEGSTDKSRRPEEPGDRFVEHVLAVAELYVGLVELSRSTHTQLATFAAEPRWPDALGSRLAPDAYLKLRAGDVADHWWCEIDLGTESLPTLRQKLLAYMDFYQRGQRGPEDVMPRVLLAVSTVRRRDKIQSEILTGLSPPADRLFCLVLRSEAADFLVQELSNNPKE